MVQSAATTVGRYLADLPAERRAEVEAVRQIVLANLPSGYTEDMGFGMITHNVPLSRLPETYNKQPLNYIGLAAQKHFYGLYLMSVYSDFAARERLERAFAAKGTKLDMGKACIRFKRASDLPLDEIGQIIAATSLEEWVRIYEESRTSRTTTAPKKVATRR